MPSLPVYTLALPWQVTPEGDYLFPGGVLTPHDAAWWVGPGMKGASGTATFVDAGSTLNGMPNRWEFSGSADQFIKLAFAPTQNWAAYVVRIWWVAPGASDANQATWRVSDSQIPLGGNPAQAVTQREENSFPMPPVGLGASMRYDTVAARIPISYLVIGETRIAPMIVLDIERRGASDSSSNLAAISAVSITRSD